MEEEEEELHNSWVLLVNSCNFSQERKSHVSRNLIFSLGIDLVYIIDDLTTEEIQTLHPRGYQHNFQYPSLVVYSGRVMSSTALQPHHYLPYLHPRILLHQTAFSYIPSLLAVVQHLYYSTPVNSSIHSWGSYRTIPGKINLEYFSIILETKRSHGKYNILSIHRLPLLLMTLLRRYPSVLSPTNWVHLPK